MLKRTSLLLAGLLAVAACDVTFDGTKNHSPRAAELDRAAATNAIWNPGPGDPSLGTSARSVTENFAGDVPFTGGSISSTATKKTLILYDKSGDWGALGELYGIGAANFASHFGTWTAKSAVSYTCGEVANYDALIYIGSSYGEVLPTCFLDDVASTTKQVIWCFDNIWQLSNRIGGATPFTAKFGWMWAGYDLSPFDQVVYGQRTLNRYPGGYLMDVTNSSATVLATTKISSTGMTRPWAVRSNNFTYVAEVPFTYMTEENRYLVFADLMFDALAPNTTPRHRVLVRLEDISPEDDPAELTAAADYLWSEGIPFGFGVISQYEDPLGWYNGGTAERVRLAESPEMVTAIKYAQSKGGVLLMHGYTHQFKSLINPYTAVSGDDDEFYRVTEDPTTHALTYVGPVPGDSQSFTSGRISNARKNFQRAGVSMPAIWETPHYAASAADYKAIKSSFTTRWERSLYFPGTLSGTVKYTTMFGQLFPFVVRDAYGSKVLPENLGNIEPEPFYIFPTRFPADIVNAAEKNLVVRDGVAGFYFHPFFDLSYLRDTVQGLRGLGYEFASPTDL